MYSHPCLIGKFEAQIILDIQCFKPTDTLCMPFSSLLFYFTLFILKAASHTLATILSIHTLKCQPKIKIKYKARKGRSYIALLVKKGEGRAEAISKKLYGPCPVTVRF